MPAPFAARRMYPRDPLPLTPEEFASRVNAASWAAYEPSNLSRLWQDTAGTAPAAIDGEVRRIDPVASGPSMTIETADAIPSLRRDKGIYWLDFAATHRIYSAADQTIEPPILLLSVFSRDTADNNPYFGLTMNGSNMFQIGGISSLDRVQGRARESSLPAIISAQGRANSASLNSIHVVSSLLTVTTVDVMVDDLPPEITPLAWPAPIAGARLNINGNGSNPINSVAHAQKFYGAVVTRGGLMDPNPSSEFMKLRRGLHRYMAAKGGLIL